MDHTPGYIERLIERTSDPFDPGSLISFMTERMADGYERSVGTGEADPPASNPPRAIDLYLQYYSKTPLPCGISHAQFRLLLVLQDLGRQMETTLGKSVESKQDHISLFDAYFPGEPFIGEGHRNVLRSMLIANPISDYVNGYMDEGQVMQQLKAMPVDAIHCTYSDLLELCLVYYMCDAGSRTEGYNTQGGVDGLISLGPDPIVFSEPLRARIEGLREFTRQGGPAHDSWSRVYDHVYEQSFGNVYQQFTNAHLENIRRFLPNGRIIDYGAGTGRLSIPLTQAGYRVIAVEPSTGMVAELLRKSTNSGLDIPVRNVSIAGHGPEEPADMALGLFTVLSYITDPQEMSTSLANIARNLKPGGLLFMDLPGDVFFQTTQVMNVNKPGLKRRSTLRHLNGPIYRYHEEAEGVFEGEAFSVRDTFELRKWSWGEMVGMLGAAGFDEMGEGFRDLGWTGSGYRMFRRISEYIT